MVNSWIRLRAIAQPQSKVGRFAAIAAVTLGCVASAVAPGQPARAQQRVTATPVASVNQVKVTVNNSQTVRVSAAFTDVLVGASEIAEVIPLSDKTLYVLGKKIGTTNISVLDSSRKLVGIIDVDVGPDTSAIAAKVAQGTGSRGLTVQSAGDRLVLSGQVQDAQTVNRAVEIASNLSPNGVVNLTRVASPQQVMLQVRVLEVNRSAGRDLGVRWSGNGNTNHATMGTFGTPTLAGNVPINAAVNAISNATPFMTAVKAITGNGWNLDVAISALEERGLVRRLAEPNLVAVSGDTADFLVGGEFPVPVASSTNAGVPTITIAYKEFGVQLSFTPTVLAGGLINLRVKPEVSDLDPTLTVQTGGVAVPGIVKRRANTTVELRDGQSFAIAGLLQAQSQRTIDQFPWLGSVPVLGILFRSQSFQQRETELVVIVTPRLVRPAKPGQPLESPLDNTLPANDVDAFVNGQTGIARGPRKSNALQDYLATSGGGTGQYGHMQRASTARNGN